MLTYDKVRRNPDIQQYIKQADNALAVRGYTEHFLPHLGKVAGNAKWLLTELGYDEHTIELARIAALLHDIGNMVNRTGHAHHGGVIAFQLLREMGMPAKDIGIVVTAIGHHDEGTAYPIDEVTSALIIADKSDVRRSRVRIFDETDIHDRVNYAVERADLELDKEKKVLYLKLKLDISISSMAEYFEIFLGRMLLCQKAAHFLGLTFKLLMNNTEIF